jgi:hypothetical protein
VLLGFALACKSRISKALSLLRIAECCTVLRSRWCQSDVNIALVSSLTLSSTSYSCKFKPGKLCLMQLTGEKDNVTYNMGLPL